ncbi:MAG: PorP/SprF family type IX secretion system membrane protein [Bacteroidales bacterium]
MNFFLKEFLISLIILLCFLENLYSQDIHFTQFYASPMTMNPAQTGFFDGDWRLSGIYRNQWRSVGKHPFSSAGLAFDKIFRMYSSQINAGILYINDISGVGNLTTNRFYVAGSYGRTIQGHFVQIGLQPGIVYETNDITKYSFDNQYELGNPEIFNRQLPNGETSFNSSIVYPDVNIGILWSKRLSKSINPELGFTVFHINRPYRSLKGIKSDETHFPMRKSTYVGGKISLSHTNHIKPHIQYMFQKRADNLVIGGDFEHDLASNQIKSIFGGPLFRYGGSTNYDALALTTGLVYKQVRVGLSYDINLSSLQQATKNKGAWEVSIIYISSSTKPLVIQIPCDRY